MTRQRKVLIAFAVVYAEMMVYLLFFRKPDYADAPYWSQVRSHLNLIPFHTIGLYRRLLLRPSQPWLIRLARVNLWGNIFLFLPLGLLPPLLWQKARRFWRTLLLAAGVMIPVELLQMLLLVGSCDVDDLILNLLGASLGYWLYSLNHRSKKGPGM